MWPVEDMDVKNVYYKNLKNVKRIFCEKKVKSVKTLNKNVAVWS